MEKLKKCARKFVQLYMLESLHGISDLSTVELLGPNVKFLKSLPYVLLLPPSLDLTFYIRESGCVYSVSLFAELCGISLVLMFYFPS